MNDASKKAFSDDKMNAENDNFIKNDFEKDSSSDLFGNPASLVIGVITCFILLFTIYYVFLRKKISKGNNVLLVGPSNSGKTLIFGKLVSGKTLNTFVSIKENQGLLKFDTPKSRSIKLIDIPGHESIRLKFFDKFKVSAGALLFILDASTFQRDMKDTAEFLYTLLTDNVILSYKLPLLVVCNKQDLISAKSSTLIRMGLEKELTQLNSTQEAALDSVGGAKSHNKGRKISFEQFSAEFVELDGKSPENGLEKIKNWISFNAF